METKRYDTTGSIRFDSIREDLFNPGTAQLLPKQLSISFDLGVETEVSDVSAMALVHHRGG